MKGIPLRAAAWATATAAALLVLAGSPLKAESRLVSLNGNFLFYNAPNVQRVPSKHSEFLAYLTRWGGGNGCGI
ncbi:hypothetical protein [Halothiobacillus sp.]|uniref:hypothetical protein n=1 Tax=Halothiobacillus sp. TaxID=1891311 RepID=UPI002AD342A8|nr:hypothetical protein [Halothiobacillus sp.]